MESFLTIKSLHICVLWHYVSLAHAAHSWEEVCSGERQHLKYIRVFLLQSEGHDVSCSYRDCHFQTHRSLWIQQKLIWTFWSTETIQLHCRKLGRQWEVTHWKIFFSALIYSKSIIKATIYRSDLKFKIGFCKSFR